MKLAFIVVGRMSVAIGHLRLLQAHHHLVVVSFLGVATRGHSCLCDSVIIVGGVNEAWAAMEPEDANNASRHFLAIVQRVGDGIVEVLLAIFGLVIALSGLVVPQLERTHAPIVPMAVPTPITATAIPTPIAPVAVLNPIPTTIMSRLLLRGIFGAMSN